MKPHAHFGTLFVSSGSCLYVPEVAHNVLCNLPVSLCIYGIYRVCNASRRRASTHQHQTVQYPSSVVTTTSAVRDLVVFLSFKTCTSRDAISADWQPLILGC
jgi:hypothetical protein